MLFRKKKEEKVKKVATASKIKIHDDGEVQEGELVEREWDIKKIGVGFIILVLLMIVGSYVFFPPKNDTSNQTLGVSTQNLSPTPPLPDQEDVQGIINNAQTTLNQITSENLTSSDAAIQQVINDLQGLQGKSGARNLFCKMICKN